MLLDSHLAVGVRTAFNYQRNARPCTTERASGSALVRSAERYQQGRSQVLALYLGMRVSCYLSWVRLAIEGLKGLPYCRSHMRRPWS